MAPMPARPPASNAASSRRRRSGLALTLPCVLLAGIATTATAACTHHQTTKTTQAAADPFSTTSDLRTQRASTTEAHATSPTTPEAEVKAAYIEIRNAYYRLMAAPDPGDATIRRHHIDPSYATVVNLLKLMKAADQVDRFGPEGPPTSVIYSVRVTSRTAVLDSCIVDDIKVIDKGSGSTVDGDVVVKYTRSTLQRVAGVWKLRDHVLTRSSKTERRCRQ
jgi:hypothetical protein